MLIVPALEYEKQRQQPADWNKVILHREGKFYRTYEWSLWLIKKFVCTEEFQKQRGDDKMLSAKRYVGKKTGEYAMSGFPVESLSKYIPEYQSVRPMEGGDDLEVTISLPLQGDETYEQLFAQFGEWKQSLGMYEPEDKKGGRGKDAKPRGGAFAIVSKLLAYPVERKSSSENVEFISELPGRTYMSHSAVRRLRQNVDDLKGSNPAKLYRSINSMLGVLSHFDNYRLSRELFCVEPFLKHGHFSDDMTHYYLNRKTQ